MVKGESIAERKASWIVKEVRMKHTHYFLQANNFEDEILLGGEKGPRTFYFIESFVMPFYVIKTIFLLAICPKIIF